MTEIYCAKWEKVKNLVQDRGQEATPSCPLQPYCKGKRCSLEQDETVKLEALRQELGAIKSIS